MQIDRLHPEIQQPIEEWRKAQEAKERAQGPEEKKAFAFQQLKVIMGLPSRLIKLITSSAKPGELVLIYHAFLRQRHWKESAMAETKVVTELAHSVVVAELADKVEMTPPSYNRREGERRTTRTYVHMREMMSSLERQEESSLAFSSQQGRAHQLTDLVSGKKIERTTTAPYVCVEDKLTLDVSNPNQPLLQVVWQRELRPLSPTAQTTYFTFERREGFRRGLKERRLNQGILTIGDLERFMFLFGPIDESGGKTVEFRILLGTDEVVQWFKVKAPDACQTLQELHQIRT